MHVISAPLVSPKGTADIMMFFKQVSRTLAIGRQTDGPAPNSRHWLSQCCCIRLLKQMEQYCESMQ